MRGAFAAKAAAFAGVLVSAAACGGGYGGGGNYYGGSTATQILIAAPLQGSSETTVVSPSAAGTALLEVLRDGTLSFAVTAQASWLGDVTGLKIHRGPVGANGPVEVDLTPVGTGFDPATRTAEGSLNVGGSLAVEMINFPDYFYLDVETTSAPSGLVRGQLTAATPAQIHATLRGSEETTVIDATARGAAALSVGLDRKIHYVIATANPAPSAITFALIHVGGPGVNGLLELDLNSAAAVKDAAAGTITGDVVAPLALLCRMLENLPGFHLNLHATGAPSGISRGQFASGTVGLWATLAGSEEIPVASAGARGGATFELTSFTTGRAVYAVPPAQDVLLVNAAHIQQGATGVNGPNVIDLRAGSDFAASGPTGTAEGAITLDQTLFARLLSKPEAFYTNLATAAAPGGLARGQLSRSTATFSASMLGTLQTVVIDPTASASLKLLLTDVHASSFDFNITTPAAATIIDGHIHSGAAGVDGPIVINLLGGTGVTTVGSHITGTDAFTGRTAASLLAAPELFYANVHTVLAPLGVARGQLARVPDTLPPAGLTYTLPTAIYVTGTAIASNSPSSTGGAIASYSILPALPGGLALSPTTGILSGTPTATATATVYTVTASNAGGSTTANLNLTVNVAAPAGLAYATPVTYVVGTAIAANTPTSAGGAIASYSVAPALPSGLNLDTTSGVITGTPTAATAAANYVVTGTNVTSFTTATVNITVQASLTAPSGLSYSSPSPTYSTGYTITNNTPTVGGGPVASYSVSPTLPAGLTLDTTTGVISGTPTTVTTAANYTVTATNGAGFTTATVNIGVVLGAPTGLSYSNTPNYGYVTGGSFATMNPTISGGAVASYSISPALPAGVNLNTSTGVISGTPTSASAYTAYTVTATNAAGNTTAGIAIVIY